MLNDFLNKRYSTRKLSDADFESALPILAKELEQFNFYTTYTNVELDKDFKDLCKFKSNDFYINSTSRKGMKLCEHFNPNFYEIENANGVSFKNSWQANNLEKVLRWNRRSHSTPYLSELKRGIYFCLNITKNTMYRPQMAKLICDAYKPEIVLDPCAGWGGRMLGAVASGSKYIAFEPNTQTYDNLNRIAKFLQIEDRVRLICDDALKINDYDIPEVNLVLTSPPYFNLEVYTKENTQSINKHDTYQSWSQDFLKPLIKLCIDKLKPNGVSCWNVGKVGKFNMNDDVLMYHRIFNYDKIDEFKVISSKKQVNNKKKNEKNSDNTIVYKKVL